MRNIPCCYSFANTGESVSPKDKGQGGGTKDARPPLQLVVSPQEGEGRISLAGEPTPDLRVSTGGTPLPQVGSSPEVPFVGGILDVVADVVEHPMSRGAVAGIEHLEEGHHGIDGSHPSSAPPGQSFLLEESPEPTPAAAPSNQEKSRKCRHGV